MPEKCTMPARYYDFMTHFGNMQPDREKEFRQRQRFICPMTEKFIANSSPLEKMGASAAHCRVVWRSSCKSS
jgi:hypothetical protein